MIRRLLIDHAATRFIRRESADRRPLETGGILIGRTVGDAAEILEAIGPGPGAEHGRAHFRRDGEYAQSKLDAVFSRTDGELDYLGEWHSHPAHAGPSPLDRASLAWIAGSVAYRQPHPLLIICRRTPWRRWILHAYLWTGTGLTRLAITEFGPTDGQWSPGDRASE